MGRTKHLTKVKSFRKELSKHLPIQKMILFGSRVNGKPTRYSDFDFIIVSSAFHRRKSLDRPVGLHDYWHLDYPVDFLCYTPEEFKKLSKQITIVQQAVKEGIEIKPH